MQGLKIALPNGSLEEKTRQLFADADFEIIGRERQHSAACNSLLIEQVAWMRPQHIPRAIEVGQFDVGICGQDCVAESQASVVEVVALPYSRRTNRPSRVVLVAGESVAHKYTTGDFSGMSVISEYPNLTRCYFAKKFATLRKSTSKSAPRFELKKPKIDFCYGSMEALVPSIYRLGVCLTETGESLERNGLAIVDELLETQAVLVTRRELVEQKSEGAEVVEYLGRLLGGVIEARKHTMLAMNVPASQLDTVISLLPSLDSPTISALASGGRAVQSVVRRAGVNGLISRLQSVGARDVIELPIGRFVRSASEAAQ